MSIMFYKTKNMIRITNRRILSPIIARYYHNITESSYKRLTDWMVKNESICLAKNQTESTRFGDAFYYEFDL